MKSQSTASLLRSMPIWPLLATLAVQTLATMALYSLPAVAPAVARDLQVSGTLVGSFVAMAYGVGVLSALLAPGMVRKYGGVRATQAVLLAAAGMLLMAGLGMGVTGWHWPPWCWAWATARRLRPAHTCWCRRRRNRCSTW